MDIYERIEENIELKTPFVVIPDKMMMIADAFAIFIDSIEIDDCFSDFLESKGLINTGSCYFNPNAVYEPGFIIDIKNENGTLFIKPGTLKLNVIATIDLSSSKVSYWKEFNYDSDKNALRNFLRIYNLEEDGKIQLVPDEIKLLLEANV